MSNWQRESREGGREEERVTGTDDGWGKWERRENEKGKVEVGRLQERVDRLHSVHTEVNGHYHALIRLIRFARKSDPV